MSIDKKGILDAFKGPLEHIQRKDKEDEGGIDAGNTNFRRIKNSTAQKYRENNQRVVVNWGGVDFGQPSRAI